MLRVKVYDGLHANTGCEWLRYTWGSAYACFRDAQVGTLSPTKFADFVVLSDNLLTHHFSTTPSVLATYVAGERVYSVS